MKNLVITRKLSRKVKPFSISNFSNQKLNNNLKEILAGYGEYDDCEYYNSQGGNLVSPEGLSVHCTIFGYLPSR